mgnify:CR=1 FL=1
MFNYVAERFAAEKERNSNSGLLKQIQSVTQIKYIRGNKNAAIFTGK